MKKKTLAALKASIKKWERNVLAKTPDDYLAKASECPLCDLFASDVVDPMKVCFGCPVHEKTGKDGCTGTPYIPAYYAKSRWQAAGKDDDFDKLKVAASDAAKAEVEFLKSLLPVNA